MYAKRIIPCLDLKNGRVVKGTNFVNLRDAGDPVEAAVEYDRQGADELVFCSTSPRPPMRAVSCWISFPAWRTAYLSRLRWAADPYGRGFHGSCCARARIRFR